ncbi:WXG100 family type VII secretion target [Nocardia sp. NPDC052112]|uniref:WXG100 family type VII secretion target n=1 Tax=Nocardia sp. NPDC052112 TaxID=3155646 RepID=UPI00343FF2B5
MAEAPVAKLTEPEPEDPVSDKFEFLLTSNEISPTYWVQTWCKNVLGTDPLEWVSTKIAGDWEALQKAGKAVGNLAAYSSSYSDEIKSAAKAVDPHWDGNAASSAQAYFEKFADAVAGQVDSLQDISDEINSFALSAYFSAKALSDGAQTVLDMAAIAVIEWAAAEASSLTGVGLVATAALVAAATATTLKVIAEFGKLVETFTYAVIALEGIAGLIHAAVALIQSTDLPSLPTKTYDHPGA